MSRSGAYFLISAAFKIVLNESRSLDDTKDSESEGLSEQWMTQVVRARFFGNTLPSSSLPESMLALPHKTGEILNLRVIG